MVAPPRVFLDLLHINAKVSHYLVKVLVLGLPLRHVDESFSQDFIMLLRILPRLKPCLLCNARDTKHSDAFGLFMTSISIVGEARLI